MIKKIIFYFGKFIYRQTNIYFPSGFKNIVIIKIGAIGDVLMSTPLVSAIKKIYPNSKLTYVVGNWSKEVLVNNPNIDKIISFDDKIIWNKKLFGLFRLIKKIRKLNCDLGFVLDRSYLASLFGAFCNIKIRLGFDRNGEGFTNTKNIEYGPVKHEIDYNLDLIKLIKNQDYDKSMQVFFTESEKKFAEDYINQNNLSQKKIIGIMAAGASNPGQSMEIRRWPLRHYIELVKEISKQDKYQIILFGGPADQDINNIIIRESKVKALNLAGQANIKQSMSVMKKCYLFVTHDSGPMHMAAASCVPVISIFGPVHPKRKAPLGDKHKYIWKPNLAGALCDNEGNFPKDVKELECMRAITPDEIMEIIKSYE